MIDNLLIELKNKDNRVGLVLRQGERVIDSREFFYYHDLEDKLITNLDRILKKNKLHVNSLKSYKIQPNQAKETTSYKILEAFLNGLKIVV